MFVIMYTQPVIIQSLQGIFGDYNFQRTNNIIKQSGRHILYDLPTGFL